MMTEFHKCRGCDRLTTALFCCASCAHADEGKYEIHEDGLLGHSAGCTKRHQQRSQTAEQADIINETGA